MSVNITRDEDKNITTIDLQDPNGFSAFKMYRDSKDTRHLDKHEDTRTLKDIMINNNKHSQIVVKFGDSYIPLENR